jgi:hypothetical protein
MDVVRDQPAPGQFTARLVTNAPTVYRLRADSMGGERLGTRNPMSGEPVRNASALMA